MILHIFAGSPNYDIVSMYNNYVRKSDYVLGVDYGAYLLLRNKLYMDVSIGDFDSIKKHELSKLQLSNTNVKLYPKDKDFTDLELAVLLALEKNPSKIKIYGATGGRLDHFYSSLNILNYSIKYSVDIEIINDKNQIFLLKPGTYEFDKKDTFKYISFFAYLEDVKNLKLEGFKYSLDNYTLKISSNLCISNEFKEAKVTISFSSGYLLVMRTSD